VYAIARRLTPLENQIVSFELIDGVRNRHGGRCGDRHRRVRSGLSAMGQAPNYKGAAFPNSNACSRRSSHSTVTTDTGPGNRFQLGQCYSGPARGLRPSGAPLLAATNNQLQRSTKGTRMMDFRYSGILGVLILAGDIWAIINIFQSSVSNEKKLLWILVVVLLPLLGLILWFFLGPRNRAA